MNTDDKKARNDRLRIGIAQTIKRKIDQKGIIQKTLALEVGMTESDLSKSLSSDNDFSKKPRNFYLCELIDIAKYFDLTIDELIVGATPENKRIHMETGLNNDSINWLRKSNAENEKIIDMVNIVLSNDTIAKNLFETMYLYAITSFFPTVIDKDGKVESNFSSILSDDSTLLKYAIVEYINIILELIKKEYARIPNSYHKRKQEQNLRELYEKLHESMQNVHNREREIEEEEAEDFRAFEAEAKENLANRNDP